MEASNDYSLYPDHPLYGIDRRILEIARATLQLGADEKDVTPGMVGPLADAIVLELRVAGYING